jgi:hypothetical protein
LAISKKFVISVVSIAKPKNIAVFAFTYVWKSFALFYGDFCMDLYSVDSNAAMKHQTLHRFNFEVSLNASSLQFFLSVKRFVADTFYGKTSFNTSSPLLFERSSSLNASSPLLFKVTLPTSEEDLGMCPLYVIKRITMYCP